MGGSNFWDTVKGNELADTLISYLPSLEDEIKNLNISNEKLAKQNEEMMKQMEEDRKQRNAIMECLLTVPDKALESIGKELGSKEYNGDYER